MVKKDGIIFFKKKVSNSFYLCKILFSDSNFLTVLVKINNSKIFLSVGHQVFGTLYTQNETTFFSLESIENFIGTSFWRNSQKLLILNQIVQYVIKNVPENLKINELYEKFILSIKLTLSEKDDVMKEFKNWLNVQVH